MVALPGMTRAWLYGVRVACFSLAIVFVFTAATKLSNLDDFRVALTAHRLVPTEMVSVSSWAVPLCEIALGAFALREVAVFRRVRRALLLFAVALTGIAAYAAALSMNPPRVKASCGCGFSQEPVESWLPICLRAALQALACILARNTVPVDEIHVDAEVTARPATTA